MIKVSIIIPMYNAEDFIERALDSIPVRDDIEVLCIDDCSTDNTYNIVKGYKDSHNLNIRLFKNEKNLKTGLTTNVGYDNAQGKWIIGMDNDDYLLTDKYNLAIDKLDECDDYDLVFISNEVNNGEIWEGDDRTAIWTYFIKKEFLGNTRMPRWGTHPPDFLITRHIIDDLHPKIYNTKINAYHYNYPRKNSVVWYFERHMLDSEGNITNE